MWSRDCIRQRRGLVAEDGTFEASAARLHVAPSAISHWCRPWPGSGSPTPPTRCPNRHSLGSVEVLVGYRTFADTCQLNTSLRHLHLIDPMTVVTLLHPGAMGAAVGRQAVRGGSTVRRVAANRTTYVRRQGIYAEQIEVLAFTMLLPSAGSEAATRPTATARLVRCGRGRARGQACPALG
jgi:hypothetical protein